MDESLTKVLEVLGEKIKSLETTIYCKDLEIKDLKTRLEYLEKKEIKTNE